jgi:D-amino-acid dehydrogenase
VRLCRYSQAQFDEINRSLQLDYDRFTGGALYLYRDAEHFQRGVSATGVLTAAGVELRPMSPADAVKIEPALASEQDRLAGVIYCPTDESGDCHKFANALAAHCAAKMGVTFHWDTSIARIECAGDRVDRVLTDKGPFSADAYVLALGSYSPLFNRDLGLDLPIYPVKGYAMTIPIGGRNGAPRIGGVDEKYLIAWSRLGDRLRITATADFAGYDTSHSERDFAHMLATIRALFPDGADYDRASRWAGLRPMTPKGTPILGPSPKRNLWLDTGHGHIGWTMSMGSAAIVADLIAGRRPAIDTSGLLLADA